MRARPGLYWSAAHRDALSMLDKHAVPTYMLGMQKHGSGNSGMRGRGAVKRDMPRHPTTTVQIAIRVTPETVQEADEIAKMLSVPGVPMTRTDAFRAAIARGFAAIRADHASKGAPSAGKPTK